MSCAKWTTSDELCNPSIKAHLALVVLPPRHHQAHKLASVLSEQPPDPAVKAVPCEHLDAPGSVGDNLIPVPSILDAAEGRPQREVRQRKRDHASPVDGWGAKEALIEIIWVV
jgi:hypothetical protein